MDNSSEKDTLALEFRRERSIRRALTVLEIKRRRIRSDLKELINQINLLFPPNEFSACNKEDRTAFIEDAVGRLGDEAFAQLLKQALDDRC